MYKSNIYKLNANDREMPAVPVFLDLKWRGKSAHLSTKKINDKEIWIEIRPFLPPSVHLQTGDKISGRFAFVTGHGFNEFEGYVKRFEVFALTPNYHFVSLLVISLESISRKAMRELAQYRKRFQDDELFERTDPFAATG